MGSIGLNAAWGNTGTPNFFDTFNTFTPVIDIGKGFGAFPPGLSQVFSSPIESPRFSTIVFV
jgi:hypothetical protein